MFVAIATIKYVEKIATIFFFFLKKKNMFYTSTEEILTRLVYYYYHFFFIYFLNLNKPLPIEKHSYLVLLLTQRCKMQLTNSNSFQSTQNKYDHYLVILSPTACLKVILNDYLILSIGRFIYYKTGRITSGQLAQR